MMDLLNLLNKLPCLFLVEGVFYLALLLCVGRKPKRRMMMSDVRRCRDDEMRTPFFHNVKTREKSIFGLPVYPIFFARF